MGQRDSNSPTWFDALHRRLLIYNACCEDPAIDCEALELNRSDRVLVITSGGCNALHYLLEGAGMVAAVDVNPCQGALLEFKIAAIRALNHAEMWEIFGQGQCQRIRQLYHDAIRVQLSAPAQCFWDRRLHLFRGSFGRPSFYHHGGWGLMMCLIQMSWRVRGLRRAVEQIFQTKSLAEQWGHYVSKLRPHLWQRWFCWLASRPLSHALLGIPPRQRQFILNYPGGLFHYGQVLLDDLVAKIPFSTNYFMHVNALGFYRRDCCPDYLSPTGFSVLKSGLLNQLSVHTATVTEHLLNSEECYNKLVLLDHLDWLDAGALRSEWQAILTKAAPGAMVLFRSALLSASYVEEVVVNWQDAEARLGELLHFDRERAAALHEQDRVHLYGSFSIARLKS